MATPDEAVAFEDFDDCSRDPVFVLQRVKFAGSLVCPKPVIRVFGIDIDGYAITMGTLSLRATHLTPIECAG